MPAPQRIEIGPPASRLVADRWQPRGRSAGEAILLHGGGQTRHAWRDTARLLARHGWTTTAYDARGHGESAWAANGDYRQDRMVEDLFRVMELVRRPPVLIGASMGGMTSIIACGTHTAGFRALVAVDVGLQVETEEARRVRAFMSARPEGFESLEEAAAAVHAYNPARARPPSPEGLRRNLRRRGNGRWYWHWDPRVLQPTLDLPALSARLRHAATGISAPALLVRGRQSHMVTADGLDEFRRLVPHLKVVDVSGAGHMVAGDDNDSFTGAVTTFLDALAPQDRQP